MITEAQVKEHNEVALEKVLSIVLQKDKYWWRTTDSGAWHDTQIPWDTLAYRLVFVQSGTAYANIGWQWAPTKDDLYTRQPSCKTKTFRASCAIPNIQNEPKDGGFVQMSTEEILMHNVHSIERMQELLQKGEEYWWKAVSDGKPHEYWTCSESYLPNWELIGDIEIHIISKAEHNKLLAEKEAEEKRTHRALDGCKQKALNHLMGFCLAMSCPVGACTTCPLGEMRRLEDFLSERYAQEHQCQTAAK
mgnify:CR=1 FL=1